MDLAESLVEQADSAALEARTDFVRRTGFEEVLNVARAWAAPYPFHHRSHRSP
ncbi:hypothetical protein [Kitasatospora sp. NPDC017646]|uniref:hypothetical protein n=1 Tax=Kitasatospora sp. NPDC017646 TaxID=3364024 RepID=UPI003799A945